MQFHTLKLPLSRRFLTQNHFSPYQMTYTIATLGPRHFFNLVVRCQDTLIGGLELFQHSGHCMVPICCEASNVKGIQCVLYKIAGCNIQSVQYALYKVYSVYYKGTLLSKYLALQKGFLYLI